MIEYRCPKCGSAMVNVTVELTVHIGVLLVQSKLNRPQTPPLSDKQVNAARDQHGQWDGDSDMECLKCGHIADAWDFFLVNKPPAPRRVFNVEDMKGQEPFPPDPDDQRSGFYDPAVDPALARLIDQA